ARGLWPARQSETGAIPCWEGKRLPRDDHARVRSAWVWRGRIYNERGARILHRPIPRERCRGSADTLPACARKASACWGLGACLLGNDHTRVSGSWRGRSDNVAWPQILRRSQVCENFSHEFFARLIRAALLVLSMPANASFGSCAIIYCLSYWLQRGQY